MPCLTANKEVDEHNDKIQTLYISIQLTRKCIKTIEIGKVQKSKPYLKRIPIKPYLGPFLVDIYFLTPPRSCYRFFTDKNRQLKSNNKTKCWLRIGLLEVEVYV